MTEQQLVDTFLQSRNERDFHKLYDSYKLPLSRTAVYLCNHDLSIAEDCLQEMWVVALNKLAQFEWKSTLKTWLTGILINIIKRRLPKENLSKPLPTDDGIIQYQPEVLQAIDLKNAISQLPRGYREILVLHDIEGFKHKEIAYLLTISEGTSKSQLHHARRAMRNYLRDSKQKIYE